MTTIVLVVLRSSAPSDSLPPIESLQRGGAVKGIVLEEIQTTMMMGTVTISLSVKITHRIEIRSATADLLIPMEEEVEAEIREVEVEIREVAAEETDQMEEDNTNLQIQVPKIIYPMVIWWLPSETS